MHRRQFLLGLSSTAALGGAANALAAPLWPTPVKGRARVIVIGGGFGGATAAKALRMLSGNTVDVTLVDRVGVSGTLTVVSARASLPR